MQINSVSNGYGFGALSSQLQENMWQAVKRNCPKSYLSRKIEKTKLYRDYKYILDNSEGLLLDEVRTGLNSGYIIDKNCNMMGNINVSKAYGKKDNYAEMIKIVAQFLKI